MSDPDDDTASDPAPEAPARIAKVGKQVLSHQPQYDAHNDSSALPLDIVQSPAEFDAMMRRQEELAAALKCQLDTIRSLGKAFAAQKELTNQLAGPLGEIARIERWSEIIRSASQSELGSAMSANLAAHTTRWHEALSGGLTIQTLRTESSLSATLGLLSSPLHAGLKTTRLRMATLASIDPATESLSNLWNDAYRALLGNWRTRPDLPDTFWSDWQLRQRMYQAAETDSGLIKATPKVALEVIVGSGLAAGFREDSGIVAVSAIGAATMTVRGQSIDRDIGSLLSAFERKLRDYIARKLEAQFGPDYFKICASNLLGKAKDARKQALANGEPQAPLINFVDLGDLVQIVRSKTNWESVFGAVFVNKETFQYDMNRLNAVRRSWAHVRPIDGILVTESFCVADRLLRQLKNDGAWNQEADSDR